MCLSVQYPQPLCGGALCPNSSTPSKHRFQKTLQELQFPRIVGKLLHTTVNQINPQNKHAMPSQYQYPQLGMYHAFQYCPGGGSRGCGRGHNTTLYNIPKPKPALSSLLQLSLLLMQGKPTPVHHRPANAKLFTAGANYIYNNIRRCNQSQQLVAQRPR